VNLLCLEKQLRKGEAFNFAAGRPVTINELGGVIIRKMDKSRIKLKHTASRAGDIRHSYADISKARANLGFNPQFTIESGIPRVIDWITSGKVSRHRLLSLVSADTPGIGPRALSLVGGHPAARGALEN